MFPAIHFSLFVLSFWKCFPDGAEKRSCVLLSADAVVRFGRSVIAFRPKCISKPPETPPLWHLLGGNGLSLWGWGSSVITPGGDSPDIAVWVSMCSDSNALCAFAGKVLSTLCVFRSVPYIYKVRAYIILLYLTTMATRGGGAWSVVGVWWCQTKLQSADVRWPCCNVIDVRKYVKTWKYR